MPSLARLSNTDDLVLMEEFQPTRPGDSPPRPRAVTLVKIKLSGDAAGVIDVSYSAIANYTLGSQEPIENIVNIVAANPNPTELTWRIPPALTTPCPSRLSLRNAVASYFVFVLEAGNYRFAADQHPFRVEGGKSDYHYEARCVWKEGINYKHGRKAPVGKTSKVGYFIAFSDTDLSDSGGQTFTSSFNLYLDLDYATGSVPISVDPDVGYPGGNS
jgi:hypothetical protein